MINVVYQKWGKDEMMYTFESRVRYSEIDEEGKLSLTGVMNYLQDCSTFHSEELGVGLDTLKKKNRAWLLSFWQIIIKDYPRLCDKITIGTQPYDFSGGLGRRNFALFDEQGEYLVKANSIWLYYDTEKGRPVRPDAEEMETYGTGAPIEMDYAPRKLTLPANLEDREPVVVRPHHLDTNHHVNNAQYVEMARECIPEGLKLREIRAEYRKQAVLGDVIYPKLGKDGDWFYVGLADEKGRYYAVVGLQV